MPGEIDFDSVYAVSDEVAAREIGGKTLLIPLSSGLADLQDQTFALNETGRQVWEQLDGTATLREICGALARAFDVAETEAAADVTDYCRELLERGMIVEVPHV